MKRWQLGLGALLAAFVWLFIGSFAAVPAQADTPDPSQGTVSAVPINGTLAPDPSASVAGDNVDDEEIADLPDVPIDDPSMMIVLLSAGGVALIAALIVLIRK
ncbi:MAG: hypothetical protein LBK28_06655 [Propionibacteriaceae bacterium]|jgi:hypothetical protein|nr:hypothetical protein [Propionibacteriaceae bacterium]